MLTFGQRMPHTNFFHSHPVILVLVGPVALHAFGILRPPGGSWCLLIWCDYVLAHKGPEFPGLPLDVVVIRMKKRRHLRRGSRCGAGPRPVPERRVVTAVAAFRLEKVRW